MNRQQRIHERQKYRRIKKLGGYTRKEYISSMYLLQDARNERHAIERKAEYYEALYNKEKARYAALKKSRGLVYGHGCSNCGAKEDDT